MWGALFRQLAIFLFTRRGKKIAAFIGLMLLGFVTALLLDSKMYLSATFSGAITVVALFALIVQYFRQRARERVRVKRSVEDDVQRAAAAQTRSEKRNRARATVKNVTKAATGKVANIANRAKTGVVGARNRINAWRNKQD